MVMSVLYIKNLEQKEYCLCIYILSNRKTYTLWRYALTTLKKINTKFIFQTNGQIINDFVLDYPN
jgi:hypothetical protein